MAHEAEEVRGGTGPHLFFLVLSNSLLLTKAPTYERRYAFGKVTRGVYTIKRFCTGNSKMVHLGPHHNDDMV